MRSAVGAGLFVVLAAGATSAQQTQTYTYDVHGRLTGVTRTTGPMSQTTTYVLDKADNRTSRTTGASAAALAAPENEGARPETAEATALAAPDAEPPTAADAPTPEGWL
jgi:YD repeat-containing protein